MAKQNLTQFGQKVKQWEKRYPDAVYKGVQKATDAVVKSAKTHAGSVLSVRSGGLVGSISGIVGRNPVKGVVRINKKRHYPKGIHESGGVINAKRKKWLVFNVNGQWVKTKSVTIPARPFLAPALEANRKEISRIIGSIIKQAVFSGR